MRCSIIGGAERVRQGRRMARLRLDEGTIQVWFADLDVDAAPLRSAWALLSADERHRAAGYRVVRSRSRFVLRRALLRTILGRYLGRRPAGIRFRLGTWGKPFVDSQADGWLRFNVSHCRGGALFAVTRDTEVGVDLERPRPGFDCEGFVDRYFSPAERADFGRLRPSIRTAAFFNAWTRKESYVKALGSGLTVALDQFTVSMAPGRPARLIESNVSGEPAAGWTMEELPEVPGCAAAVTVPRPGCRVEYATWPPVWNRDD
jgi:4'-phosphopantetheinyl transferase